jgi:hypothetical protein
MKRLAALVEDDFKTRQMHKKADNHATERSIVRSEGDYLSADERRAAGKAFACSGSDGKADLSSRQSAIAALAHGLDTLKQIDASHTGKRLQTMRQAMADHWEAKRPCSSRFAPSSPAPARLTISHQIARTGAGMPCRLIDFDRARDD